MKAPLTNEHTHTLKTATHTKVYKKKEKIEMTKKEI